MAQALVISKDVIIELKRLALVADKHDASFRKAYERYEQAARQITSSTAEFAIALYKFALEYVPHPGLIDAKLAELQISTKQSTSVFGKISRLAFDDVRGPDGDVKLPQISKYAKLIEAAHASGMSASDFEQHVNVSIAHAMRKLTAGDQTVAEKVRIGRDVAARMVADQKVELSGIEIPGGFVDGDDVELIAKVEAGKLVVYGLVPKQVSNLTTTLQRIGARELTARRKQGDIFADIARTIRLIIGGSGQVGALGIHQDQLKFITSANGDVAVLTLPEEEDFLSGSNLALKVSDWANLTASVGVLKGVPIELSYANSVLTVSAQLTDSDDLPAYYESKGKAATIGRLESSTLVVEFEPSGALPEAMPKHDAKKDIELTPVDFSAIGMAKSERKGVRISINAGVRFDAVGSTGGSVISKRALNALKSTAEKMRRLGDVSLGLTDGHLHLRCAASNEATYHVAIKLA